MRMLGQLLGLLTSAVVLASIATVATEVAGVGLAWSRGALTADKVVRYAGVVYGLDPLDLSAPKPNNSRQAEPESREEILAERVKNTPYLAERAASIARDADDIRGTTYTLKRNREKYVVARKEFESLLDQLETETESTALRELQITMEVVAPKQAKDILRAMLGTLPADPADDVMRDVVGIIKLLPDNKLRKILAEFKTEEERKLLHRILVEIGELTDRNNQLSRSQP